MGRIKTQLIKRTTIKLIKDHPGEFKDKFDDNKIAVSKLVDVTSKKLRNTIAGYATRIVRTRREI
jgi:small subunit ribosomal protein S17e